MTSGAQAPRSLRLVVIVASNDPPLLVDVDAHHAGPGWTITATPDNGAEPLDIFVPDTTSPILNWLSCVTASAR
jgi:hypothetical protein